MKTTVDYQRNVIRWFGWSCVNRNSETAVKMFLIGLDMIHEGRW